MIKHLRPALLVAVALLACSAAAEVRPDETPGGEDEWGFRPAVDEQVAINPPRFSWRPQKGAVRYELQIAADESFETIAYRGESEFNVHAPSSALPRGEYAWRFRFVDRSGAASSWSGARRFIVGDDAVVFPFPAREELMSRVPREHPRMFVRPEQMPELRERAKGDLKQAYQRIVEQADALLAKEISTQEPPLYPEGTVYKSEQWRDYWHGARTAAMDALTPAAELGFAYQLSGDARYGEKARQILREVSTWDPKGASGYLYNDESGMPYNYLFARTYTFVHDLLSEEERQAYRALMRIRGQEMYRHLHPSHFWTPYKSHQNRAWHFLGEVAVAFHGEIAEAEEWLWFAMNVFANVYPVWSDSDGGWHEGIAYWRSYNERFTWWADIMQAAMDIDAYRLPFYSQVGYYPMYLQPPGTRHGGFGDLTNANSNGNVRLMANYASAARNGHWQWYVEAHHDAAQTQGGYIGFLRAARPRVEAIAPTDLPTSRLFRGIGQAFLNTNLLDASDNIAILFKSAPTPFGTRSHGYESQNAFQLNVFGRPVFLSSGQRDIYGSDHHRDWMWETKSVNSITVSGRGQIKHSGAAHGQITAFHTSPRLDFVQGEAAHAYHPPLRRFTRSILFAKPHVIVIIDELETDQPETFEWHLHANQAMAIEGQADIRVVDGEAACHVSFLSPAGLQVHQTDQFDPPPRERVKLKQHHLTATTPSPAQRQRFITLLRPHRAGEAPRGHVTHQRIDDADRLRVKWDYATLLVNIASDGTIAAELSADGTTESVGAPRAK